MANQVPLSVHRMAAAGHRVVQSFELVMCQTDGELKNSFLLSNDRDESRRQDVVVMIGTPKRINVARICLGEDIDKIQRACNQMQQEVALEIDGKSNGLSDAIDLYHGTPTIQDDTIQADKKINTIINSFENWLREYKDCKPENKSVCRYTYDTSGSICNFYVEKVEPHEAKDYPNEVWRPKVTIYAPGQTQIPVPRLRPEKFE